MLLLFVETFYKVIETAAPLVVLMESQPFALIKYTVDGKEVIEKVTQLNLHKE
jgi:hypothetical protein